MNAYALIFDIDGCIADWSHRLHYIRDFEVKGMRALGGLQVNQDRWYPLPNPDLDAFYAAMPDDPVLPGAVIYNLLVNQSRYLHRQVSLGKVSAEWPAVDVISCRPEKTRAVTVEWFERNGLLQPRAMHMRADDDDRPHAEIKLEIYKEFYLGREEVVALFDDNAETIAAFREVGVPCYQVS